MILLTKEIPIETAIFKLEERRVQESLVRYARSFSNRTVRECPGDCVRNRRNQRGLLLKDGDELLGISVMVKYDMHGREIFSEWREVDELAVLWVPAYLRGRRFGSLLLKYSFLNIVNTQQNPKWIYVRATDPKVKKLASKIAIETGIETGEYEIDDKSDFMFDVRSRNNKSKLTTYCQAA